MKYRIHVSGTVLNRNATHSLDDPPVLVRERRAVRTFGPPLYRYRMAHGVSGHGTFRVVHKAGRVWLETDAPIILDRGVEGLDREQPEPPED